MKRIVKHWFMRWHQWLSAFIDASKYERYPRFETNKHITSLSEMGTGKPTRIARRITMRFAYRTLLVAGFNRFWFRWTSGVQFVQREPGQRWWIMHRGDTTSRRPHARLTRPWFGAVSLDTSGDGKFLYFHTQIWWFCAQWTSMKRVWVLLCSPDPSTGLTRLTDPGLLKYDSKMQCVMWGKSYYLEVQGAGDVAPWFHHGFVWDLTWTHGISWTDGPLRPVLWSIWMHLAQKSKHLNMT